jgi:hypothetical protein
MPLLKLAVSLAVCPLVMLAGVALKLVIVGAAGVPAEGGGSPTGNAQAAAAARRAGGTIWRICTVTSLSSVPLPDASSPPAVACSNELREVSSDAPAPQGRADRTSDPWNAWECLAVSRPCTLNDCKIQSSETATMQQSPLAVRSSMKIWWRARRARFRYGGMLSNRCFAGRTPTLDTPVGSTHGQGKEPKNPGFALR